MDTMYRAPDWDAPLDVESYLRATPRTATSKGMFTAAVIEGARRKGIALAGARERYLPFADYPLTEHMQILVEGAQALFPEVTLREGLRRLGRGAYDIFVQSTVGKVIFSRGSDGVAEVLGALVKAYEVTEPSVRFEVIEASKEQAVVRWSGVYSFLDSHH